MRAALAILAALPLALGACSVDVEGAPCGVPGGTDECPDGQACGAVAGGVGRCSRHAGECVAAGMFCSPGEGHRCSGAQIQKCVAGDDCGAWALDDDCGEKQLVCSETGGSAACVCATPDTEIAVDPAAVAGNLAPTGAASPAACRFKTITVALAYAKDVWRPAHGGAPATIRARGAPTQAQPALFQAESFPIQIPSGVTVTTESSPPNPAAWVVSADPASDRDVVQLASGAAIEGFTLRSVSASGDGIVVGCGAATAPATAKHVRIDGRGMLRNGVSVQETCGLDAVDLEVRDASQAGVLVDATLADPATPNVGVTIDGGALAGNGTQGAELRAGFLALSGTSSSVPFSISGNHGFGVSAQARDTSQGRPYAAVNLELSFADVWGNWEAGAFLSGTSIPASAATIASSRFHGNLGKTAASAHAPGRRGAGLLLKGAPIALTFTGNQVFANGATDPNVFYDQVAVYSTAKWAFSGSDCQAGANAFACPATGGYLVYSSAVLTANYAQAGNAYWPVESWPPDTLVFHTSYDQICAPDQARLPACTPP